VGERFDHDAGAAPGWRVPGVQFGERGLRSQVRGLEFGVLGLGFWA
jgi:hypothetical protein